MSEKQSKPFIGGVVGFLNAEKLMPLIPIILLVFLVLTVSSLIIWPYLLITAKADGAVAGISRQILTAGWIGLGVTAGFNMLLAAFSEDGYSAEKSISFCTWLCPIVVWISMAILGIRPMGAEAGRLSAALNVIVIGITGLVLSILPACIAIILGWITRIVCGVVGRRL